MQLCLVRSDMQDLTRKTIDKIVKRENRGRCVVICYSGKNYAVFDIDEYSFIIMDLPPAYKERLKKAADFTVSLTKPDCRIPQVGDNDGGRIFILRNYEKY